MDETAFLSKWYEQNSKRRVEIIGLAYEVSPDFEVAKERIKKMKDRYKDTIRSFLSTIIYAGLNVKDNIFQSVIGVDGNSQI